MSGWSDYADFTSVDTLRLAWGLNVKQALTLAWIERQWQTRNTIEFERLWFPTDRLMGLQSIMYYIMPILAAGSYCNPETLDPLTELTIAAYMGEPLRAVASITENDVEDAHYIYRLLNALSYVSVTYPTPGDDFGMYETGNHVFSSHNCTPSATTSCYPDAAQAFDGLTAWLRADTTSPTRLETSGEGFGGFSAGCMVTTDDIWGAYTTHKHGTLHFSLPSKIWWKTTAASNSVWVDLNLTNVPTEWTLIGEGTDIVVPAWQIIQCPSDFWASYNGSSNTFSQNIECRILNGGLDFEFVLEDA